MKQIYIIIVFIFGMNKSNLIIALNIDTNINKEENKIKNITNIENDKFELDNQIKILIEESNTSLGDINNKSQNLSEQLLNIKFFDNENIYLRNILFYLCLIIFLAILIYILENKWEKKITSNKINYSKNNDINNELKGSIKLLF